MSGDKSFPPITLPKDHGLRRDDGVFYTIGGMTVCCTKGSVTVRQDCPDHYPPEPVGAGPPFDDSPACPMCPQKIRNLYATAHNLVVAWEAAADWDVVARKVLQLSDVVKDMAPLQRAHFADRRHSHG